MTASIIKYPTLLSLAISVLLLYPGSADAHCDSMGGPVVKSAEIALQTGNVNLVLIWVTESQEAEIRESFHNTMKVRSINEDTRKPADRYFFETLVRLHREAEGAPYTGLKPADTDFGPAIPAAEKALETGSLKEVRDLLVHSIEKGLHHYYDSAAELKDFDPNDIQAGRAYVNAYVQFMHYVNPVYRTATADVTHEMGEHDH